jgi:S1-C subfamily serine protease
MRALVLVLLLAIPQTTVAQQACTESLASLFERVSPSVVSIQVTRINKAKPQRRFETVVGSGVLIERDGQVLTNAHVIDGAASLSVTLDSGARTPAKVLGMDTVTDLALLRIETSSPLPVARLGDSSALHVGDEVVAIGNPMGLEQTMTRGIVSGLNRILPGLAEQPMIQTDAPINPGNSGGPLVDANGCVIGINTAVAAGSGNQPAQNVGFAIPISYAKPVVEDIKAGRKPAFLGIGTTDLTPDLKNQLGVNVDNGAVVEDVTGGSPADDAGLQRGDVIVEIGDTPIKDGGSVATAVRKHRPGEKVTVTYLRGSDRKTADVTLVERPDAG